MARSKNPRQRPKPRAPRAPDGSGEAATPTPSKPVGTPLPKPGTTPTAPPVRPAGPRPQPRRRYERPPSWWSRYGLWLLAGAAVVIIAIIVIAVFATRAATPTQTLAPAGASGQTVDGIPCQTNEQVRYHVHAHLAIFVNGQERLVPYAIGIKDPAPPQNSNEGPFVSSGSCFYWLHTHTQDGVIHIESPDQETFTLGQFFDIWGQPLSGTQVGPAQGTVIAYVNGQRYSGDPRAIPLTPHALIQLDIGQDVAPKSFSFPPGD